MKGVATKYLSHYLAWNRETMQSLTINKFCSLLIVDNS